MTRFDDWATRLEVFVWERSNRPFVWGVNDCCTFAADWVRTATGHEIDQSYRGTYRTGLGALMHVLRGGGLTRLFDTAGLPRIDPELTQRGDIVGVPTPLGIALGVFTGDRIVVPGRNGLVDFPSRAIVVAWRV